MAREQLRSLTARVIESQPCFVYGQRLACGSVRGVTAPQQGKITLDVVRAVSSGEI